MTKVDILPDDDLVDWADDDAPFYTSHGPVGNTSHGPGKSTSHPVQGSGTPPAVHPSGGSRLPILIGTLGLLVILLLGTVLMAFVLSSSSNEPPQASLTASTTSVLTYETILFNGSGSTDRDGTIVEYSWDTNGDGLADDGQHNATLSMTFSDDGDHVVKLWVTDDAGTVSSADITVHVANRAPVSSISASSTTVPTGTLIRLTPIVDDMDGRVVSVLWDLDGDGSYEKRPSDILEDVGAIFGDDGIYTVHMRATDDDDAATDSELNLTITDRAPYGSLIPPDGDVLTLMNISIGSDCSDDDGSIEEYQWDIDGDGVTDNNTTSGSLSIDYAHAGTYTVGCNLVDDDGVTTLITCPLTILNRPPAVVLLANGGCDDLEIQTMTTVILRPTASDPDGNIVSYEWDLDGDGTFETSAPDNGSRTMTFNDNGVYSIGIRVSDDQGDTTVSTRTITVNNRPPVVSAQTETNEVFTLVPVNLTGTASDPDGSISYYQWDLDGDGSYDTGHLLSPAIQHIFYQDGVIPVTLRVVDDDGAASLSTITMTVLNTAPLATLKASRTNATNIDTLELTVTCSDDDGYIVKVEWDLDGDSVVDITTTKYNVSHRYENVGNYNAVVTVTDDDGARTMDSLTISIVGNHAPVADAGEDLQFNMGTNVTLDGSGSYDPDGHDITVRWDLTTDGTWDFESSTSTITYYEYPTPGTYTATIWVGDGYRNSTDSCQVTILSLEQKFALVIGISDYPGTANDLNYCDDDARDWKSYLEGKGFTVRMLIDSQATSTNIGSEISWIKTNSDASDSVVFTYSGHGIYYTGDSYICAYDSDLSSSWLASRFAGLIRNKLFLFFDCCESGAFQDDFTGSGNYVAQACRIDEYSLDDPYHTNGAFTYYFLNDGLALHSGWSLENAFDHAYSKCSTVYGTSNFHPQEYDGDVSSGYFL